MGLAAPVVMLVANAWAWECFRDPVPLPGLSVPPSPEKGACVDPVAAAARYDADGTFDGVLRTEHFEIDYDTDADIVSEDYLASLAEWLETSWTVEVDELGWPPPEGSDTHFVQVILANLPAEVTYGGVAVRADCGGETVGYILLNTDFWYRSTDYLADVPSHELNHLLQYASGAPYGDDDEWFYEATAVWMEDRVSEDTNTYANDFLPSWLEDPAAGLREFMYATGPQYGHFVFPLYLDEHEGGPERVRDLWVEAEDGVLGSLATQVGEPAEVWARFLSRMVTFDVEDHEEFVDAYAETDGWYTYEGEVPAAGEGDTLPDEFGAAWLHFTAPEGRGIRFTLTGDERDGWVAGGTDGEASTAIAEDGVLTLSFTGSEAWIGVGPTEHDARDWSWVAEAVEPEPEPKDEEAAGCGCASSSAPGSWVFAALLLVRRRVIHG